MANSYAGIHDWLDENKIKNEKGDPIEFYDHPFLIDIYDDNSQYLTIMKAAQVGMSSCSTLKNHHDSKNQKMDIVYTLPTDSDVRFFVGGKVNRIIANNPSMIEDVADQDSIEQKRVGSSMTYYRGTWTKKAAIMITADRLVHDEKDSSKLDVIADYQSRLQHSKMKQVHTFSHPSLPETGVHADWLQSDQKHWFVKCESCGKWQFLSWNIENSKKMSVDIKKKRFRCKKCDATISDRARRTGQWVAKHPGRAISGYWIPLLIAPWTSAKDLVSKYKHPDTTPEFFYTKVLGLPYADGSAKLLRHHFVQNLTEKQYAPEANDRVIIGIDTGLKIDYVMGNQHGLFYHGDTEGYGELDALMQRWDKAIAVIDQGGDLIGARAFAERWPGRVIVGQLGGEKRGKELVRWGTKDESGSVQIDRNRVIQLVVDEFRDKRIPVHGTEDDWFEYWLDWNNLTKIKVLEPDTNVIKGYKWARSGRDHRALATVFWRVGMMRFAGTGGIYQPSDTDKPNSYVLNAGGESVLFDPEELFGKREDDDWRNA